MDLHFKRTGHGPPLILLHGFLGSLDNLDGFAKVAAAQFTVFSVDQRNHGHSPHHDEMSYDAMADDLERFCHAHELPSIAVLGHSMGGKTAMHFARTRPERVARLVVVDISPRAYPPDHVKTLEALLALDLTQLRSRAEAETALARSVDNPKVRAFLLKNLAADAGGQLRWKSNVHGLYRSFGQLLAALPGKRSFHGPALFIAGGKSQHIHAADAKLIHELFPQAVVQTIPQAGHWVHVDAPAEFARLTMDFLLS
jgi:pimeloyl-ACP methyl ester carboxylesterase